MTKLQTKAIAQIPVLITKSKLLGKLLKLNAGQESILYNTLCDVYDIGRKDMKDFLTTTEK